MIITPALSSKKEQFDAIYLNLHQNIRAHSAHVGVVCGIMAQQCSARLFDEYGISADNLIIPIMQGGDYHDIGKCSIPYHLFQKNFSPNQTETETIRQHPGYTTELLHKYSCVLFDCERAKRIALDMGHYHHEKYDGSGYPKKLKGDKIPFAAQLCALADFLDNRAGDRRCDSFDFAAETIIKNKGIWFSPEAVACFEMSQEEIKKLYTTKNNWIKAGLKTLQKEPPQEQKE